MTLENTDKDVVTLWCWPFFLFFQHSYTMTFAAHYECKQIGKVKKTKKNKQKCLIRFFIFFSSMRRNTADDKSESWSTSKLSDIIMTNKQILTHY